ncbi:MmcQ/YjbR family DNA-binding protein [Paenibacillus durus]|uniref:Membrane protein n=1 Tax=Paenibacillus durus ATCC 35681 TaxID=1333534 RepID=A0A0F7FE10_PAEDU|nr:MmcQ/YjbR family DNA-binding protein [Paenibacillus durus]AKG37199.1 membrane protein [Paenibacillus durus ATCC 35681]
MTIEEITEHCLSYPSSYEDHPFGDGWTAMRHQGNKKIFALIYNHDGRLCVNLKCPPDHADFLRKAFEEVKPGYHMNKEHWNTVILDGDLPEDEIHDMVHHSFELTKPKRSKKHTS